MPTSKKPTPPKPSPPVKKIPAASRRAKPDPEPEEKPIPAMTADDLNQSPSGPGGDSVSPDAPPPPPPEDDTAGQDQTSAEGQGETEGEVTPPAEMAPDEFREFFCDMFNLAGTVPPLRAMTVTEPEIPAAHRAADALYRMAGKYKWLRWLRSPSAFASADMMAIGMFLNVKLQAVARDLAAQRARAKGAPPRPNGQTKTGDADADYYANFPRADDDEQVAA